MTEVGVGAGRWVERSGAGAEHSGADPPVESPSVLQAQGPNVRDGVFFCLGHSCALRQLPVDYLLHLFLVCSLELERSEQRDVEFQSCLRCSIPSCLL